MIYSTSERRCISQN